MFQMTFYNVEEAKNYILTDKVTNLPLSTQALYLHILFNGQFDKDGNITNLKTLARTVGASDGDIQLLTDEKFYKEVKGVAGENK